VRNQRTLKKDVAWKGVGLHSGKETTVVAKPAEPDSGVVFVRVDLPNKPRIPLGHATATRRDRQSAVSDGKAEVGTVEHLAAGLFVLGLDNVVVEIDGDELPGLDGSGSAYARGLRDAGRVEQKAPKRRVVVKEPVAVSAGESAVTAFPNEGGGLKISYTLDYGPGAPLRPQHVAWSLDEDEFFERIAPARTFCLEVEARKLREAGFGKGATTQNTLVIGEGGLVDNAYLFEDEPARHKVLDLLGDLMLLGADLEAHVVAVRTGHKANLELVKRLDERRRRDELTGATTSETGLDVKEIMKIIPHRYPFLFVDRVISLEGYRRAVGVKNVSINEPYFEGHWPGQPILPGVVQVEALAQLSGVLLLRRLLNTQKVAVLLAIDKIKFRRAVRPGDQLRLECETVSIRASSAKVLGRAFVGDDLTCEAMMKFMLMDS
jgi:UDP-3-O-[3-hydroxymyristoyl] N-acetylglucosamine deacetylase / 3-hydroxyacyl-[acyl-carrier-protein] dehydratase